MRVFYSWQADTPNKIGRAFIREAIDSAATLVSDSLELSEAERIFVDQDTQGVLGSPAIAETILSKISDADIVIADVTLIGHTERTGENGKKLINSNVAIELGYTIGAKSDAALLCVMNTYYGGPNELPFDLRHRRHPVRYHLEPNGNRSASLEKLSKELAVILKYYRNNTVSRQPFIPIRSTFSRGSFWNEGDPIASIRRRALRPIEMRVGPRFAFLRLWPKYNMSRIDKSIFLDGNTVEIPLACAPENAEKRVFRNEFGKVCLYCHEIDFDNESVVCGTQILRTGEIWGIETTCLGDGVQVERLEQFFEISVNKYEEFLREVSDYKDEIIVQAGIVGIRNWNLRLPYGDLGLFHADEVVGEGRIDRSAKLGTSQAVTAIMDEIYQSAGTLRPDPRKV